MINVTAARRTAEHTLTAACRITRAGTDPTFDPATGTTTAATASTVYDGPCGIYPATTPGHSAATEGAGPVSLDDYRLRLPAAASGPTAGDVVTITDPGPHASAGLAGRTFTVVAVTDRAINVLRTLTVTARDPSARV